MDINIKQSSPTSAWGDGMGTGDWLLGTKDPRNDSSTFVPGNESSRVKVKQFVTGNPHIFFSTDL